jgi:hypothetical protein
MQGSNEGMIYIAISKIFLYIFNFCGKAKKYCHLFFLALLYGDFA